MDSSRYYKIINNLLSMNKERRHSLYGNFKHDSKKHCENDNYCKECCPCKERLTLENKILAEKVKKFAAEKAILEKDIMRQMKEIKSWESKKG